jgi:hypothetical protein
LYRCPAIFSPSPSSSLSLSPSLPLVPFRY